MIGFLDFVREITLLTVIVRVLISVLCGGLIGLEREYKRRPTGFRTHILICLGAAMTTLTGQYLVLVMNYNTDMGRLGAQVVSGVGFIGAGCIMMTKRNRIKGLTTAAGLWTTAIVGLCCGAGFIEGALVATALVLIAETGFLKIETRVVRSQSRESTLYVEYKHGSTLDEIIRCLKEYNVKIVDIEITHTQESYDLAIFSLQINQSVLYEEMIQRLANLESMVTVQQL